MAGNSASGTIVGTLSATDPDGDTLSISLTDNAGGRFAISGNRIVAAGSLDFETATSHSVTVRVPDTLTGTSGNDTIAGVGGNDAFVLSGKINNDTIQDFGNGNDRIDLSAYGLNFDELCIRPINDGVDTLIKLSQANSITFDSFYAADLTEVMVNL